MTLAAAILLLGVSSLTSWNWGLAAQSSPSSTSSRSASAPQEQAPENPSQTGTATPKSEQTPNTQSKAQKPKSPPRKRHKKKVAPPDCDPAPANPTTSGSSPAAGAPADQTSTAPKPCPPAKVVVRQGGISEQSIQLAGASNGDDASGKRDAANRMLVATEENLKKVAGRPLSTAEQDSASQIRQFVTQSKSALATGDLERAQTLAWKAKLLSDDLVNPGK